MQPLSFPLLCQQQAFHRTDSSDPLCGFFSALFVRRTRRNKSSQRERTRMWSARFPRRLHSSGILLKDASVFCMDTTQSKLQANSSARSYPQKQSTGFALGQLSRLTNEALHSPKALLRASVE